MDGFSGYNQIKMAPEDMEKTTFIAPWGTFCYRVMPFVLKNAGATYQRAMTTVFHDMMHKEIEVYVDDMIAKLRSEVEAKLTDAEWVQSRYDQLNLIEEKRLTAMGANTFPVRKNNSRTFHD